MKIVYKDQEILCVSKQESSLKTGEVIKIFETSNDLEEIRQAVRKAEERLVVNWASVEIKDNAGELIPINDLIKEQEILLERNGPITDTHTNKIHGQTLAFKVMENQNSKSLGVLHLDKMFAHDIRDDKVWGEIKTNERTGVSVGGFNTSVSLGKDSVTGESVRVLEGFNHRETATVRGPCNPLALNEAFSVVAKSDSSKEDTPLEGDTFAGFDTLGECVASNLDTESDPVGYCMGMRNKSVSKETDINKPNILKNNKKNEGDPMESDELKKSLSEMKDILKSNSEEIAKLKKAVEAQQEEEEPPKDEEKKKKNIQANEELLPTEDEEKKKQEMPPKKPSEEEEEEKKKEAAAGDIAGEEPAKDQPESSLEEQSNQENTFKELKKVKKELQDIKKMVAQTAITPHPAAAAAEVNKANVAKAGELRNLALDIATGKKTQTWQDVHKAEEEYRELSGGMI